MSSSSSSNSEKSLSERRLHNSLQFNKSISILIDSIENLGCKLPSDFFRLRSCDSDISGGFSVEKDSYDPSGNTYGPYITICDNKKLESETFTNTIIHELIHAYDTCRVKSLNSNNCTSLACTEIRAAALSGECSYLHEIYRGNLKFQNGHRECVKRRAGLSMAMNPSCKENASNVIDQVFEKCYQDTAPFPRSR